MVPTSEPSGSATRQQIRSTARALLIEHGAAGVTLRAIARALGITAPALYRYYSSHSDLIAQLRHDISDDLAGELTADMATPDVSAPDGLGEFFAVCRGFRRWALRHPQEYILVFASPAAAMDAAQVLTGATEQFGKVFLTTIGEVLTTHQLTGVPDEWVPAELRSDVRAFRDALLAWLQVDENRLPMGVAYLMVQYWTRIYGHVTLEVFGSLPIPVSVPGALFDAMLADIARDVGLGAP